MKETVINDLSKILNKIVFTNFILFIYFVGILFHVSLIYVLEICMEIYSMFLVTSKIFCCGRMDQNGINHIVPHIPKAKDKLFMMLVGNIKLLMFIQNYRLILLLVFHFNKNYFHLNIIKRNTKTIGTRSQHLLCQI